MNSVLITGATGLVGGAILKYFHGKEAATFAATSSDRQVAAGEGIEIVPFGLRKEISPLLEDALNRSDAVIHSAAMIPARLGLDPDDENIWRANTEGTLTLMKAAVHCRVKTFIYISTTNLFPLTEINIHEDLKPQPISLYLLSKVLGENIGEFFGRQSETRFFSLRISAPYGPGYKIKSVIPIFVERAIAGLPLELVGSGERLQTFTNTLDVARACDKAIVGGDPGVYNIAGAEAVTMRDLAEAVISAVPGSSSKIVMSGRPDSQESLKRRIVLDKAKHGLDFEPQVNLEMGLASMVSEIQLPSSPLICEMA